MRADRQRLGKLIGLSDEAVDEHIVKGIIAPGPDGLFDPSDCFKRISQYNVTGKVDNPHPAFPPNAKLKKIKTQKPKPPEDDGKVIAEAIKAGGNVGGKNPALNRPLSDPEIVEIEPFDTGGKKQKARADVTLAHMIERATVRKMIVDGAPKVTALKHMTEKMGMTLFSAQKYYQEVVDDFKKIDVMDREFEINRARARFEDLYALARSKGDYRSATVILKEYLSFFGVTPDPLVPEEKEGAKIAQPMIYLPDNGREATR